jgi:predicted HNH restriction endonuclease
MNLKLKNFHTDACPGTSQYIRDYRAHIKEHYPEIYEARRIANNEKMKKRYAERNSAANCFKHRLVEEMGGKCQCCGLEFTDYNMSVCDFHHVNGEKSFEIASKIKNCVDYDMIKEEAMKCAILCANCHRLVHNKKLEINI